jgi:quinol monooxygenase YgiN
MSEYINLALIRAKAGQSEALGEALLALVNPSREEPGCRSYNVYRSFDDEEQWMVFEKWGSKAALEEHLDRPHMKAFSAQLPSLVNGELDLRGFLPAAG